MVITLSVWLQFCIVDMSYFVGAKYETGLPWFSMYRFSEVELINLSVHAWTSLSTYYVKF